MLTVADLTAVTEPPKTGQGNLVTVAGLTVASDPHGTGHRNLVKKTCGICAVHHHQNKGQTQIKILWVSLLLSLADSVHEGSGNRDVDHGGQKPCEYMQ